MDSLWPGDEIRQPQTQTPVRPHTSLGEAVPKTLLDLLRRLGTGDNANAEKGTVEESALDNQGSIAKPMVCQGSRPRLMHKAHRHTELVLERRDAALERSEAAGHRMWLREQRVNESTSTVRL